MKAGQIFSKTMPFVWAKLLLGLATVLVSAILFAILMGLGWLFDSSGVLLVMFIVWLGATGVVRFLLMHYLGYMLKAGHVAVITEAVTTGVVPANQIAYGKERVKERFLTSNIYFVVDKLVSGAVKQIQKGIGKIGNALDFIPGMGAVTGLAQFFVELSLGYIDECCLGYTFYRREQGAFKSAADGVAIYAQNWKKLLATAGKTMAIVILGMIGIVLVLFIVLALLFRLFAWPGWVAFVIAILIALAIKFAFIDSYMMVKMMVAYMQEAPTTVIAFDLYGKLSGLSSKFKELLNKGRDEAPGPGPAPAYAGSGAYAAGGAAFGQNQTGQPGFTQSAGSAGAAYGQNQASQPGVAQPAEGAAKPIFCGQCGAKNERGVKFCGSCGAPLG
jgi:hypothetical protein